MKEKKYFTLFKNIIKMIFHFDMIRSYTAYYNKQSQKGWQVTKAGFASSTFIYQNDIKYRYVVCSVMDLMFDYYNWHDAWEYVCQVDQLYVFRTLSSSEICLSNVFSDGQYEEEKEWLEKQAQEGLSLKRKNRNYYFEKGNPSSIQYIVELQHKLTDIMAYINYYIEKGWYFICEDNHHYYFCNQKQNNLRLYPAINNIEKVKQKEIKDELKLVYAITFITIACIIATFWSYIMKSKIVTNYLLYGTLFWVLVFIKVLSNYIEIKKAKKSPSYNQIKQLQISYRIDIIIFITSVVILGSMIYILIFSNDKSFKALATIVIIFMIMLFFGSLAEIILVYKKIKSLKLNVK